MTTEKKSTKNEVNKIIKSDWIDFGIRALTTIATAYATGYITSVAAEHRSIRRAKKASKVSGGNVHLLENKRVANN